MNNSQLPIVKHINNFLDYIDVEKGLSKKTQENYARFLNRFVRWLAKSSLGGLLPHELTPEIIWKYRIFLSRQASSEQSKDGLSKSTQNYYLIALRVLLEYFAEKDIASLPASKIKLAKQPKNRSVHFLTLDKVRKLLDAASGTDIAELRDRAIMETLFSTGLRVAELVKLDRDQINVKNTQVVFELNIIGKGGKSRLVYFSPRSLQWLKKYSDKRTDIDKALFINFKKVKSNNAPKRLTARSVERIIKKYTKIAGLPLVTTPHTLRHSFATDLLTHGVDLRLVQEFLGHEDISTTQIYTHVTNKNLRDVYKKFHGGGQ